MSEVILHLFLNLDDVKERLSYLSATEISFKIFNSTDCILDITVRVSDTSLMHPLEFASKRDDVEDRVLRQ